MESRPSSIVGVVASLVLVGVLLWPYAVKHPAMVATYYGSGLVSPLWAGALAVGVIVALVAVRRDAVSPALGAGVALGMAVFEFLAALLWALTARLDVFVAPGWAFPAQRWVLAGLGALVVVAVAVEGRAAGILADVR